MKKKIIGSCPVCDGKLIASELTCVECGTKIVGEFNLSKFDYLTPSQQEFALVFIKNGGNIKAIEKELNISYPTVKKNLDDVISALGFECINIGSDDIEYKTRQDVLKALKNREISFETAEALLKEME